MEKARELRRRMRSVEKTRQITRTMEMVSASKLKRAQDRVVRSRPYARALVEVITELFDAERAGQFPLLRVADPPARAAVVLITSNRGLCGGFNANLSRLARERLMTLEDEGVAVELHAIGRKGIGFFRYAGQTLASQRIDIGDRPTPQHAVEVVGPLMERFERGELDIVEVVYGKFNSPVHTPPAVMRVLPVSTPAAPGRGGRGGSGAVADTVPPAPRHADYLLRPSAEAVVGAVLPLYVRNQMYRALVETAAAEHGARRTAMKNATDSAGEMIDWLRRTYNRARQTQITQEIAEIVGGAEALQG
jgi:F-type H+-transporting ATPase subunit gamma